jgi:quercetin dioxygenase-like cupin family protein
MACHNPRAQDTAVSGVPDSPQVGALSHDVGTRLLHEDAHIRVWLLELAPGEATNWHAHQCDYVFVVTQPGTVRGQYVDGAEELQRATPLGTTEYRPRDTPHRLVNEASGVYSNVVIELKATASGRA